MDSGWLRERSSRTCVRTVALVLGVALASLLAAEGVRHAPRARIDDLPSDDPPRDAPRSAESPPGPGSDHPPRVPPPLPPDSLPDDLFDRPLPRGLPDLGASASVTRPQFDLGRRLFFDAILSRDRTVSCASCHDPRLGFTVQSATAVGVEGRTVPRNPPTLFNRAFGVTHSWDGRAESLEAQMLLPIHNPMEMDLPLTEAIARLRAEPPYPALFRAAFAAAEEAGPELVTEARLAQGLAAFVRKLTLGDSPVDAFLAGDENSLTTGEKGGMWVFDSKGKCWRCHSGPNFTDEAFHNTGVGVVDRQPEPGRLAITGRPEDRGAFKTPTLRGLARTAPYMHDGSLKTLEEVVEFYRRGGNPNSNLDGRMEPLELTDGEARDLVEFLRSLSRRERTGESF